jgi:hypothetical protein
MVSFVQRRVQLEKRTKNHHSLLHSHNYKPTMSDRLVNQAVVMRRPYTYRRAARPYQRLAFVILETRVLLYPQASFFREYFVNQRLFTRCILMLD